jgi:hypothetical protein
VPTARNKLLVITELPVFPDTLPESAEKGHRRRQQYEKHAGTIDFSMKPAQGMGRRRYRILQSINANIEIFLAYSFVLVLTRYF